jgi:hypothetical protein
MTASDAEHRLVPNLAGTKENLQPHLFGICASTVSLYKRTQYGDCLSTLVSHPRCPSGRSLGVSLGLHQSNCYSMQSHVDSVLASMDHYVDMICDNLRPHAGSAVC